MYYNYRSYNYNISGWLTRDLDEELSRNLYSYARNIYKFDFGGLAVHGVTYRGVYRAEKNHHDTSILGLTNVRVEVDINLNETETSSCASIKVISFWIYRSVEPRTSNKYKLSINDPDVVKFLIKIRNMHGIIPSHILDELYLQPATYEGTIIHEETHVRDIESKINEIKEAFENPVQQNCWSESKTSERYNDFKRFYENYLMPFKKASYPEGREVPPMFDITSILPPRQEAERRAILAEWNYYASLVN